MRYYSSVFAFITLFFACSQPEKKANKKVHFKLPAKAEINSVVHAIIEQDSTSFKKRHKNYPNPPINLHLFKADIIYGKNWRNITHPITPFFDLPKDSAYLKFQDSLQTSLDFDSTGIGNYVFIDQNKVELHKNDSVFCYTKISVPQFSADGRTAYIQRENVMINAGCGVGLGPKYYYLRKENNRWKIIETIGYPKR